MLAWLLPLLPGFALRMAKSALDVQDTAASKALDAEMAHRENNRSVIVAGMAHKAFWVAWLSFALPLGLWWNAVMLDTVFGFGWGVSKIPPQLVPWADVIFNNLFYSGSAMGAATLAATAYAGRR